MLQNRLYQLNDRADQANAYVNEGPGGAEDIGWTDDVLFNPQDGAINTAYNYGYDALGNLIRDEREEIASIEWTVAGKVKRVERTTGSGREPLTFGYGADGQRIMKQVGENPDLGTGHREYYVRDAQGNIMAIYRYTNTGTASFRVMERPIYGSSRLGSYDRPRQLLGSQNIPAVATMSHAAKRYELTDHLGNVSTVVTGRLLSGNNAGSPFQAEVVSAHGYEPFGSLLPGRNYSSSSYRLGFQGQEKDDEMHGAAGTSIAFEYRMHDARVGRFWSIDPLASEYPWNSPYAFSENKVIEFIELEGLQTARPAPRGAPRLVMPRYQRLEMLRQIRQSRANAIYREKLRVEQERLFNLRETNPAEYYRTLQGMARTPSASEGLGRIALSISRANQIKRDVENLQVRNEGSLNEVRSGEVLGQQVQINSGHGFNRAHETGTFAETNLTRAQVESAIMSDLLNQPRSSIPEARGGPIAPFSRNITVEGIEINYKAVRTENGLRVGTYAPVIERKEGPAQQF